MMSFSQALLYLKHGKCVARTGWNGRDMYLYLVQGSHFKVNRPPLSTMFPEGTNIHYHAHIDMKTAQGYCVPWVASQADLLTDDWVEVELVHETRIVRKHPDRVLASTGGKDEAGEENDDMELAQSQRLR